MNVTICMGSNCVMMGSMSIQTQVEDLKESLGWEELEIEVAHCLGLCKSDGNATPVVIIDGVVLERAASEVVMEKVMAGYHRELPEVE